MFSESCIPSDTVQAYLETEYRVHENDVYVLRVGQVSTELLAAHKRRRAQCSAFITACNPFSQSLSDNENRERQAALEEELRTRGLAYAPGIGQHPSNQWPGEESFLIFDLSLEAAKKLGVRLEQNALIWCDADAKPQLILLR